MESPDARAFVVIVQPQNLLTVFTRMGESLNTIEDFGRLPWYFIDPGKRSFDQVPRKTIDEVLAAIRGRKK